MKKGRWPWLTVNIANDVKLDRKIQFFQLSPIILDKVQPEGVDISKNGVKRQTISEMVGILQTLSAIARLILH